MLNHLQSYHQDVYTVYNGSIYHIKSKEIIERPAFLYDKDDYILLNIGNVEWCQERYNVYMNSNRPELFQSLKIFVFDERLSVYQKCELMNRIFRTTGYIKNIVSEVR